MSLELTGKLIQVLPEQSGTGRNGNWVKQEFIVEFTDGQFPRKVCFSAWGDRVNALKSLEPDSMVKVNFNLESREYNNRWYTDARAWRIQAADGEVQPAPGQSQAAAHTVADMPEGETKDDLPF